MTGAAFLDWKTRTPSWGAQPLDTPEAIPKRHFQLTPSSFSSSSDVAGSQRFYWRL